MNKSLIIRKSYFQLFERFGPQNWWPTTLEGELHPSYHGKKDLNEKQIFEIIIGSLLVQGTSWNNVEKAIVNLNKHDLINLKKLLIIEEKKLAELIRSSGYYNQKAKKIKSFCEFLRQNPISQLKKYPAEKLRGKLLEINGVGPETADSIMLYAFDKPIFVVDAYTRRLFSRIGIINEKDNYDDIRLIFEKAFEKNKAGFFNEYHALIVEFGKNVCKKWPECDGCPLKTSCNHYKNQKH